MPPRYAYWTILIDGKATAFRARERDELLPTFNQLARKNTDLVMRYFARGKLWDSPEQAEWAKHNPPKREVRTRDWRPGGTHADPRNRAGGPGNARGAGKPGGAGWKRDRTTEARKHPGHSGTQGGAEAPRASWAPRHGSTQAPKYPGTRAPKHGSTRAP